MKKTKQSGPTDADRRYLCLRYALKEALHEVTMDRRLPRYLENALLKYEKKTWRRVNDAIAVHRVIEYHKQGKSISRESCDDKTALAIAASDLCMSAATVERALRKSMNYKFYRRELRNAGSPTTKKAAAKKP